MLRLLSIMLAGWTLVSCSSNLPASSMPMTLTRTSFDSIVGWGFDDHYAAFGAFLKSCDEFATRNDTDAVGKKALLAPVLVWKNVCLKADRVAINDSTSARKFFEREFAPMVVNSDGNGRVLVTGYYEALLHGSREQKAPFVFPVYAAPTHHTTFTREQIDLGFIKDQARAIAYVDDPVKLFFMQIQGSGTIQIAENDIIRVGYGGNNNQPYTAIGKVLVDKGYISNKDVSMQTISQWLYAHPKEMWHMMWENQHYVFFQEMNGGPFGSERVALTPKRSLAVDQNFIPLGMPVFVDTVFPGSMDESYTIVRRLMIAQDTGQAIVGPLRGDVFLGSGTNAEQVAGRMKSGGTFVVLVPRAIADKMDERSWIGNFFHNLF